MNLMKSKAIIIFKFCFYVKFTFSNIQLHDMKIIFEIWIFVSYIFTFSTHVEIQKQFWIFLFKAFFVILNSRSRRHWNQKPAFFCLICFYRIYIFVLDVNSKAFLNLNFSLYIFMFATWFQKHFKFTFYVPIFTYVLDMISNSFLYFLFI